jgi:hypothetical protein
MSLSPFFHSYFQVFLKIGLWEAPFSIWARDMARLLPVYLCSPPLLTDTSPESSNTHSITVRIHVFVQQRALSMMWMKQTITTAQKKPDVSENVNPPGKNDGDIAAPPAKSDEAGAFSQVFLNVSGRESNHGDSQNGTSRMQVRSKTRAGPGFSASHSPSK